MLFTGVLIVFLISSGGESHLLIIGLLLPEGSGEALGTRPIDMRDFGERMRRGRPSSPLTLSLNKVMSFERVKASTAVLTFSGVVRIMAK